jgi:hypothetical protein
MMLKERMTNGLPSICALWFLIPLSPPSLAQNTWATISGHVVDSSQAAVPEARVRALTAIVAEPAETATDASGQFSLTFLPAGSYRLQITAAGFKPLTKADVIVTAGQALELTLILEVEDFQEGLTVGSTQEQVQTATNVATQQIDKNTVRELPTIGRQGYNLLNLAPGVILTQDQLRGGGFAGLRNWDTNGNYIINGGLQGTNQFLLNNAPISVTGSWQFSPSIEAVQEVRIFTNSYDAQFGRTGGGTVNTTLRSGTDRWHAQVNEFLHNAVLDANSSENNSVGAPRGKHITNQFGATAGGPIHGDSDSVFFSFEGFREIAPYPVVSDTLPIDLRNGKNFSAFGIKVYDPLTARICRSGADTPIATPCFSTYIRLPFPHNMIPDSRISVVGQNIISLYPAPTGSGLTQNYLATGNTGHLAYVQPIGRWDRNFGEKTRFFALFTFQHSTEEQSNSGFPAQIDIGTGTAEQTVQNYIADFTRVISPSTVIDARASFGRFTVLSPESGCSGCVTAEQLGISNFPHAPTVTQNSAPRIDLASATSIIGNTFSWNTQNQMDFAITLTTAKGHHDLHFGLEYAYSAIAAAGPGRANGELSFTGQWTQQYVNRSSGLLDGSGVADLLLGIPYSGYIDYNNDSYRSWPYYAGFVQDTWKVRPRFTLSLGFRYDVQLPFLERHNRINQGFDLSSVNPLSAQIIANWKSLKASYDAQNPQYLYPPPPSAIYGGRTFATPSNRRPYDTDWTDLQPRLGLAWNLTGRTVIRAGAGIFYRTATNMNYTNGFSQQTAYTRSTNAGILPAAGLAGRYSLENPFPNGISNPTGASLGLDTNIGNAISYDSRTRPIPRTYEYSVGFQRQLPWSIAASFFYAGSMTVHDSLPVAIDNPHAEQYAQGVADPYYLNRQLPSPFIGILPVTSTLGSQNLVSAYNLLRTYPTFSGIELTNSANAKYRSDAFEALIQRRVGSFSWIAAYTFSKSFQANHRLNNWNLAEQPIHELSPQNKPQNLTVAGTWDIPLGWGRAWANDVPRLAGAFINGWSVDWVLTYSSGYPVAQPNAQFTCASYAAPGGPSPGHWFNNDPKCYQSYPLYTLRTNQDFFPNIRTPTAPQVNFSVEKNFWIGEKCLLQFRGEAYNATNTAIFPGPNTNYKDSRFGELPLQQSNFPRYGQVSAKFVF